MGEGASGTDIHIHVNLNKENLKIVTFPNETEIR